jgi:hypothetical protein
MMNRINQNCQLSSKSLFDDRQINHSLQNRHEKNVLFSTSSSNRNNRLCYETKIDHEMKKLIFKSFSIVLVNYEKDHIYWMLRFNEIIYRVLFVIWIKKKHLIDVDVSIKTSIKRSIIELIDFLTKRQILESNLFESNFIDFISMTILIST